MAKKSKIECNNKRRKLVARYRDKRLKLLAICNDLSLDLEERLTARMKLAALPRNSSPTRVRNRCNITGRPRAYYRRLGISRLALRELGSSGLIPGLVKSSW